jgi:hypothetical protein
VRIAARDPRGRHLRRGVGRRRLVHRWAPGRPAAVPAGLEPLVGLTGGANRSPARTCRGGRPCSSRSTP